MADVLQGATNQFNFRELPNGKIILSEEAYIRLSGCINLCAFSGNEELEYGTFLYGYEIAPNVIYFDYPSKFDDYEPHTRYFEVSNDSNMYKELVNVIEYSKVNCIAHVHTHPYAGVTSRYFSNQDLRVVQVLQRDFQPTNINKKMYFLGGLLTVSPENIADNDEISFVFYDEITRRMYKIVNISVFLNNKEVPLQRVKNRPKMRI